MKRDKQAVYNELLVLRCQRSDPGAMEELIRTWEKRLFYYIHRLVDDEEDAWDVLQRTWVKVLRAIGSLREPRSLPTWLYRIARNTAMSHWRTQYANHAAAEESGNLSSIEGDSENFRFDDAEQVHYGLGRISLPHREVLTLHFLEDLPIEEVAEVIGVPPGTVKSRLHYAKRALRAVLEQED